MPCQRCEPTTAIDYKSPQLLRSFITDRIDLFRGKVWKTSICSIFGFIITSVGVDLYPVSTISNLFTHCTATFISTCYFL